MQILWTKRNPFKLKEVVAILLLAQEAFWGFFLQQFCEARHENQVYEERDCVCCFLPVICGLSV